MCIITRHVVAINAKGLFEDIELMLLLVHVNYNKILHVAAINTKGLFEDIELMLLLVQCIRTKILYVAA
jgi:hypothetical protein